MGSIFIFSQQGNSIPFFKDQSPGYKTTLAIEEFIISCAEERTKSGIYLLGLQGGWIYPEEQGVISQYRDPEFLVEQSHGFSFLGTTPLLYWDYYDDPSDTFKQNIPSYDNANDIHSMKTQLENYVRDTLNEKCLRNFNQFEDVAEVVFDIVDLEITSLFRDEEIEVKIILPIEIIHKNIEKVDYLDSYSLDTENKLRVPYFLAKDITNTQSINSLFEKNILSTLLAYQSTEDTTLLPPFADTTNSYDVRIWNLDQTQTLVQMILENTIGNTQFRETKETQLSIPEELQDLPLAQGLQNVYVKHYLGENREYSLLEENQKGSYFREYDEMLVQPQYNLLYPISFTIENGYADFLFMSKPQMLLPFPVQVSTTDYQASYKLTAPIVLAIKDSRQDPNDNFVFNLPLEINIKHNAPLRENYVLSGSQFDSSNQNIGSSLICNPSQFKSKPYTINITDSIHFGLTGERGVKDALVEFECSLGVATCTLGVTDIVDNQTYLNFQLPENCFPGNLKISKFGHQTIERIISEDREIDFGEVDMPSSKEVDVLIGRINTQTPLGELTIGTREGESGIIVFEHTTEESMTRVVNFDDLSTDFYDAPPSVELLPGSYSIQLFIFDEDPTNKVAKSEFEVCDGGTLGFGGGDCETYELPEFNLTSWITGQYVLDTFEITSQDLLNHEKIIIPYIGTKIPSSYVELEEVSEYSNTIPELSNQRLPELCNTLNECFTY